MTRRRLAKELGRIFLGIMKEEDLIGGIDVPRLMNGITMNEKHEEYLKWVEESVGITGNIDSVEMRVTKDNRRKKWKGDYTVREDTPGPGKKKRRSYAKTVLEGSKGRKEGNKN